MEKTANPAPLGLMGFGMTTVLLNLHNAGFFPISSMILAMGLFYGGLAQIIAGFFWVTLVGLILGPQTGWVARTPESYMACFFVMWGIFTLFMFLGTLRSNRALQFVFLSLTVLFALLALRDFTESRLVGAIAGWEGILCGASAIYLAMAEVLSEQLGRDVLPIGKLKAA
jgi:hypothetical protein